MGTATVVFRPHRGLLSDSMAEKRMFSSLLDLIKKLSEEEGCDKGDISVSYYGYDDRVDWETYILKVNTLSDTYVVGFMTFA